MNIKVRIIMIAATTFLLSVSIWTILNSEERKKLQAENEVLEIIENNRYSEKTTEILSRAVQLLSEIEPKFRPASINEKNHKGGFSIIVINAKKLKSENDLYRITSSLEGNIIAVGNRYILIDEEFLSKIAINARLTLASQLQLKLMQLHQKELKIEDKRRIYGLTSIIRYANSNNDQTDSKSWDWTVLAYNSTKDSKTMIDYTTSLHNAGFNPSTIDYPLEPLAAYQLTNGDTNREFPFSDILAASVAAAIAPYLLHELAHLENGYGGAFLGDQSLNDYEYLNESIKEQENRADQFAIETIKKWRETNSHLINIGGFYFDITENIFVSGKILEDLSLNKKLSMLRLENSQMLGSFITYANNKDCKKSQRGFADINYILDIREILMPILTMNEFNEVKKIDTERASSHPHLYYRGMEIQKISPYEFVSNFEKYTTQSSRVRKILGGDTASISKDSLRQAYISDITRIYPNSFNSGEFDSNELIGLLVENGFRLEDTAACPFDSCANLVGDGAYAEVGSNSGKVIYAAIHLNHFSMFPVVPSGHKSEPSLESTEVFARKLDTFGEVFSFLTKGEMNLERGLLRDAILRHVGCGFSSFTVPSGRSKISFTTTDNRKSILVIYVSSQD